MSREGGVVYKSQVSAIQRFDAETQCKIYDAFFAYLFDGIEPDETTDPIVLSLLDVFKPQIDANNKRYENGKKGGRKPKNKDVKENSAEKKSEPILVDGDVEKERERSIFAPDIDDVKSFIALKGLNVNAEEFWHHYDALNWELNGRHPDWRKLLMSWGAKAKERQYNKKPKNTVTGSVFADLFVGEGGGNGN